MDTNTILSILSLILAAISVATVIITLKQNTKILEATTRPYVTIYFDYTQTGTPFSYFIVKNFGSSSAVITSLTYNDAIRKHPVTLANMPSILDGLVGSSIAPGQKVLIPFHLYEYTGDIAIFDISYRGTRKKYTEHIKLPVKNYGNFTKPRLETDYQSLAYPLSEIAERLI